MRSCADAEGNLRREGSRATALHRRDLGEEAVPADVESPVADSRRARNAAHDASASRTTALVTLPSSYAAGGRPAGADHHGVCSLVLLAHSTPSGGLTLAARSPGPHRVKWGEASSCGMLLDADRCLRLPSLRQPDRRDVLRAVCDCRTELRATMGADAKDVAVEYEPKMNVTPNAWP